MATLSLFRRENKPNTLQGLFRSGFVTAQPLPAAYFSIIFVDVYRTGKDFVLALKTKFTHALKKTHLPFAAGFLVSNNTFRHHISK